MLSLACSWRRRYACTQPGTHTATDSPLSLAEHIKPHSGLRNTRTARRATSCSRGLGDCEGAARPLVGAGDRDGVGRLPARPAAGLGAAKAALGAAQLLLVAVGTVRVVCWAAALPQAWVTGLAACQETTSAQALQRHRQRVSAHFLHSLTGS